MIGFFLYTVGQSFGQLAVNLLLLGEEKVLHKIKPNIKLLFGSLLRLFSPFKLGKKAVLSLECLLS